MSILIVGSDGQDGKILSSLIDNQELCLKQNKYGIFLDKKLILDLTHYSYQSLANLLKVFGITKIFFFAAVSRSTQEIYSMNSDFETEKKYYALHNILETTIRAIEFNRTKVKFFFASSSLIFAGTRELPQNENTKTFPLETYARDKVKATEYLIDFGRSKEFFELYIGIFYNHESVYRKKGFFTRKVIETAISILLNPTEDFKLSLLNVNSVIDISHAEDFMRNLLKLVEVGQPGSYIFSKGQGITTLDFVSEVFDYFHLDHNSYLETIENESKVRFITPLIGMNTKLKNELGNDFFESGTRLSQRLCKEWMSKFGYF